LSQQVDDFDAELTRRHRAASLAIYGVFALTLLLVALSFSDYFSGRLGFDPVLDGALRIAVVVFGLGAIALRRARFAAPRLQAVAALRGASGLIESLQKTTVLVALIAAAIALMGFALTLVRGDEGRYPPMVWIGLITFAVLAYAFPRRSAWRSVVRASAADGASGTPRGAKGTAA
jgi:hypothetical protein